MSSVIHHQLVFVRVKSDFLAILISSFFFSEKTTNLAASFNGSLLWMSNSPFFFVLILLELFHSNEFIFSQSRRLKSLLLA
jgi:hypothetical protein